MRRTALNLFSVLRGYIDGLIHPSVQHDPLTAARHRAFIAPRLLGSFIALSVFPLYLAMRGVPTVAEIAVLGWLVVPILTALFLSRTGRYEQAHVLSSLALTGLICAVAYSTGGISSFAAVWLVLVPFEAALSASRRVVVVAAGFAMAGAGLLIVSQSGSSTAGDAGLVYAFAIISAALYATGLAFGVESLARKSLWLLYAEEDRYRMLARNMTDVITRHGRNGAVLFVSPAAKSLFAVERVGELQGQGLFDRVHVADRPAYLKALADAAAQGMPQSAEFRVKRPAGEGPHQFEFIWVEMRCRPLEESVIREEGVNEVVAVIRDISDRKLQAEALEEARHEWERANAAKTRFLATMSHELRTPLNAIIGFSEMLVNEELMRLDAVRRREYAQLINDSGNHLLAVVNGILDMSKMETGDFEITPEPFAPATVVSNCCDLLALKAAEAGIDLVVHTDEDLPDIVADKRALRQVLLNLVSNAIKFTNKGGRIIVSAKRVDGRLQLSVQDNGIGISAADLPRIGNPFFQARSAYDRRHDGTGLGLSIVKGLVALHGGDMQVRSELGKGTCISISLPLDCEGVAPPKKKAVAPTPFELARKQNEIAVRKSA